MRVSYTPTKQEATRIAQRTLRHNHACADFKQLENE